MPSFLLTIRASSLTPRRQLAPAVTPTKRQELIAKAFMPQLAGGSSTPAFAALVKRLQESLSRLEEFEVVVAAQNANEGASPPSLRRRRLSSTY